MKEFITQNQIKSKNLSDILRLVIQNREITRKEIQTITGYSWGKVSTLTAELIGKGLIVEKKLDMHNLGRKSSTLSPTDKNFSVLALDVNISGIFLKVVAMDGTILNSASFQFVAKTQGELLDQLVQIVSNKIGEMGGQTSVVSIGISMQGIVSNKSGVSYHFPLPDWKEIDLKKYFEEKLQLATFIEHDPKCLLIAESSLHKEKDILLVRIDDSVGLAVMQEGKILNDTNKFELGKMKQSYQNETYSLSEMVSISGVAKKNDCTVEEVVLNFEKYLLDFSVSAKVMAKVVYNLSVLFNPQKIIFSGKLVEIDKYKQFLFEEINKIMDEKYNPTIVKGTMGADFGVAMKTIENYCSNLEL